MSNSFGNIGDMLTDGEQKKHERTLRRKENMSASTHSFGNIGDVFPTKEIKCRIRGCNNKVVLSGRESMNVAAGALKAERMCDECYAKLQTLEDKEMPCSKPGCKGTWNWNRYQQLEAIVCGRTGNPHGLCKQCQEEVKQVKDIQRPCRIKGCSNTWTYTAREQLLKGKAPAPSRMCDECYKLLNSLQDKVLKCRMHGCEHTILWNRFQQLEYIRSGKSPDSTPSRMCDECYEIFKTLQPIEVPCRIKGCQHTWTFTPNDQLEEILAGHLKKEKPIDQAEAMQADIKENQRAAETTAEVPVASKATAETTAEVPVASEATAETTAGVPVASEATAEVTATSAETASTQEGAAAPIAAIPSRMCNECYRFFKNAVDIEEPCKNHNCKNTWTYTKSMQLCQKHHAKEHVPVRYCGECTAKLNSLSNKEMPCSQDGCPHTWTYTKEEQLKDQSAGKEPRNRRCQECTDFVASHPSMEMHCEKCGAVMAITSLQQLEHHLGKSTLPTLCADCAKQDLNDCLNTNKSNQETK